MSLPSNSASDNIHVMTYRNQAYKNYEGGYSEYKYFPFFSELTISRYQHLDPKTKMRRLYLGSRSDFLNNKLRSKLGSICVHDFLPGDIMKVTLVENTNDKLAVAYRFVASDSKDESKDGGVSARYVQRMRIYDLRNGSHWCKDRDGPQKWKEPDRTDGPRSDADIDELLHQAFQEYQSKDSSYKSFYSNDLYQDFMLENT